MHWKTTSFPIVNGRHTPTHTPGIQLDGVELRAATRQQLYIEGRASGATWDEAQVALVEYWQKVVEIGEQCLPSDPVWTTLRIQVEPEGGSGQLGQSIEEPTAQAVEA